MAMSLGATAGSPDTMTILVTCASRHGGTRAIAETIAAELETRGHTTTFSEVSRVRSLDGYDAVVLGSGVYMGHWLPKARAFVEAHQAELSLLPVWIFSSGTLGRQPRQEPAEIDTLTMMTNVIGHVVFGGHLDVHNLGIGERLMVRMTGAPTGDFRDWQEIRDWACLVSQQMRLLEPGSRRSEDAGVVRLATAAED
jgi:menaquinone-dependent protoporphyrinogen oxidase